MNILLISQCNKKALVETRHILDQFAERRGDRSWQTSITRDGLHTLRRLLRKTARKNTAVACHWIRGLDHSELMWIVGDASQFNEQGAVPTATTSRDVIRRTHEDDWHSGEMIRLLAQLAALLHDLGKAMLAFQNQLKPGAPRERNLYRHEWVSLRLFEAFVGDSSDAEWLARLGAPTAADDQSWLTRLECDGLQTTRRLPFGHLPPLAQALGWLVLSHHRLPLMPATEQGRPLGSLIPAFQLDMLKGLVSKIDAQWNESRDPTDPRSLKDYWTFRHGLPVTTPMWRQRAARLARRLHELQPQMESRAWLDDPYVMHLARLSLMLADHHYSSLGHQDRDRRIKVPAGYPLYANTDRKQAGQYNQTLDEHLLGVERESAQVARALSGFERQLPRLARHKGLRKRSQDPRFRWQDHAFDLASGMREHSSRHGAFIVNMASTGSGKTLANARIMYALSDPQRGMRCAFAMGLRNLTLQTGHAFATRLHLGDDELAIRVGGDSRMLFQQQQAEAELSGSASTQKLLDEDSFVRYEGNVDADPLLNRVIAEPSARAMLIAPILVCTVDHLIPATESRRGGRQIVPMLRLLSGDLVLDEPDEFDLADMPALARLVHWAGLLGSRVLLSSATLPPALVQGLFEAYLEGRRHYQRNRGERPGQAPQVVCAWIDEHRQQRADCADLQAFAQAHHAFASQRHQWLQQQATEHPLRKIQIQPQHFSSARTEVVRREFAAQIQQVAGRLHRQHHSVDPHSGKRISFGLIRMANIEPLFDVARALYQLGAPEQMQIHLCVYHSQYPLLLRSAIERRLDQALDRNQPDAVFQLPDIRSRIDAHDHPDQLFIVLSSPVTETGRDHDYDWAIVEPSSVRSLVQLAGRVQRHRKQVAESANIVVWNSNLKHAERPQVIAFCRPGFEGEREWRLQAHTIDSLLLPHQRDVIDARPRLLAKPAAELKPQSNLVDLEHARLQQWMLPSPAVEAATSARARIRQSVQSRPMSARDGWQYPQLHLTAVAQQQQPFRADNQRRVDLVLLPNEDDFQLWWIKSGPGRHQFQNVLVDRSLRHDLALDTSMGPRIAAWAETDYLHAVIALAEALEMPLADCARRFGKVSVPDHDGGWYFHPALGFSIRR